MTLREELQKLARIKTEYSKEKLAQQIRNIGEKNGEVVYQVIMILTKEKMKRGFTIDYSLKDLKEKLPWKKSTLIEKLQELVKEGVMKHEKRKYRINMENEMVKRIWNYYNKPHYGVNETEEEVREQLVRKRRLEKELEEEERKRGRKKKYRKATRKEEKSWIEETIKDCAEGGDVKEVAKEKLEILGYRKQEKEE